MCHVAVDRDYSRTEVVPATDSRRNFTALALALAIGAAMGFAEARAAVLWPPVAALVVACAALAVAAPRAAWGLGLTAGLAAALASVGFGRGATLLHAGVLGAYTALLPALAATHVGQWVSLMAARVRTRPGL